jgi:hypothetical protein
MSIGFFSNWDVNVMKLRLFPIGSFLGLVCALIASPGYRLQATTVTIDFTGIPEGTPLSANNPYGGGVVDLQAQSGYSYGIFDSTVLGGIRGGEVWTQTGVIISGGLSVSGNVVLVDSAPGSILPAGAWTETSMTSLTANFLQPVTALSFTTWIGGPWSYGYTYEGIDQNGVRFDGGGVIVPDQWVTTTLDAPSGGYLTELKLSNSDRTDGTPGHGLGALELKSMALDVSNAVPEPSSLGDKALLLFVAAIAPLIRRKRSLPGLLFG